MQGRFKHFTPGQRLAAFFMLTHGLTWLFFLGAILAGGFESPVGTVLFSLSVFSLLLAGPVLAYLTFDKKELSVYLNRIVDFSRIGKAWLVIALVLPFLLVIGAALASYLWTGNRAELEVITSPGSPFLYGLFPLLFSVVAAPLFEEMAWRGYGLAQLQKRFSALASNLCFGFAWALWHVPLFFIPGTYQNELGAFSGAFWLFMLAAVAGSIIIGWIYNNNGSSTLTAILYHAMWNLAGAIFITTATGDAFYVVLAFLVSGLVVWWYGPQTLSKRKININGG